MEQGWTLKFWSYLAQNLLTLRVKEVAFQGFLSNFVQVLEPGKSWMCDRVDVLLLLGIFFQWSRKISWDRVSLLFAIYPSSWVTIDLHLGYDSFEVLVLSHNFLPTFLLDYADGKLKAHIFDKLWVNFHFILWQLRNLLLEVTKEGASRITSTFVTLYSFFDTAGLLRDRLKFLVNFDERLVLFPLADTIFTVVGLLMNFLLWFRFSLAHQ